MNDPGRSHGLELEIGEETGRRILFKPFGVADIVAAVAEVMSEVGDRGVWEVALDGASWREVYRIATQGQRGTLLIPVDVSRPIADEPVRLIVRVGGEEIVFEGRVSTTAGDLVGDDRALASVELSVPKDSHLRLANALLAERSPGRPSPPIARGSGDAFTSEPFVLDGLVLCRKR